MAKFEVFKDKAGEFRFRYKASNGEIMFSSEGYKARASALDAIESIKKNAAGATVDDLTKGEAAKPA
ncbi:YegP family protein [Xanthobacter sediminis]|uniref:YegP family protein n=1 Tax=Xanthobacter sediminis TaxID=3119926 RepID=UPI0037282EA8